MDSLFANVAPNKKMNIKKHACLTALSNKLAQKSGVII